MRDIDRREHHPDGSVCRRIYLERRDAPTGVPAWVTIGIGVLAGIVTVASTGTDTADRL
jgi:hypothetical protein